MQKFTKVFVGANEMVDAVATFLDKTRNRYDVYSDSSGSSLMIGSDKLANKFFEFKNKGGTIRYIAEITQHNYELYKKIMEHVELRHIEGTKGYFRVNESEYQYYISFPSSSKQQQKQQQDFILVSTTNNEIVKKQQEIFEILWNKAIPSEQRIKEIEEEEKEDINEHSIKEHREARKRSKKKKIQLWTNQQKNEYVICLKEDKSKLLATTITAETNQNSMNQFTKLLSESEEDSNYIEGSGYDWTQKLYELIENEKEKEFNKRMLLKLGYFVNDGIQETSTDNHYDNTHSDKKHVTKIKSALKCHFCRLQFSNSQKRKEHEQVWHPSSSFSNQK